MIKVARILVEDRRKDRVAQNVPAEAIAEVGGVTFSITRRATPVPGVAVVGLLDPGRDSASNKAKGVEGAAKRQLVLLL